MRYKEGLIMENANEISTEEKLDKALNPYRREAESTIENEDKFEGFVHKLAEKLKIIPGVGEYLSDIVCLVSLVRSYIKKEYTDIPLGTIISIVATLTYIVSPIDLIPDTIPGVGYLDDIGLLVLTLKFIHSDVEEYKQWREKNNKDVIYSL